MPLRNYRNVTTIQLGSLPPAKKRRKNLHKTFERLICHLVGNYLVNWIGEVKNWLARLQLATMANI